MLEARVLPQEDPSDLWLDLQEAPREMSGQVASKPRSRP